MKTLPVTSAFLALALVACAPARYYEVTNGSGGKVPSANRIALLKTTPIPRDAQIKTSIRLQFDDRHIDLPPAIASSGNQSSVELQGTVPLMPSMRVSKEAGLAAAQTLAERITALGNWRLEFTPRVQGGLIELTGEIICNEREEFGDRNRTVVAISAEPGHSYAVPIKHPNGDFVAFLTPSIVR